MTRIRLLPTFSILALTFAALSLLEARAAAAAEPHVHGTVPAAGGVGLVVWSGGPVTEVTLAALPHGCEPASIWASVDGRLVGYRQEVPAFVNAAFFQRFPNGELPTNTPLILICNAIVPMPAYGLPDSAFDIGPGVPDSQVEAIKQGFELAGRYLAAEVGGDISPASRALAQVKIIASGEGNQEPGGSGACCTAFAVGAPAARPFFDIQHPHWSQQEAIHRVKIAAHEYAHGWHAEVGCMTIDWVRFGISGPFGAWFNEGVAEYVAYAALIHAGLMDESATHGVFQHARLSGELSVPLSTFDEGLITDIWPGHVGFLAVQELVRRAPTGDRSLRTVCEEFSARVTLDDLGREVGGQTRLVDEIDEAFLIAFGITRTDFHVEFEQMRQSWLSQ